MRQRIDLILILTCWTGDWSMEEQTLKRNLDFAISFCSVRAEKNWFIRLMFAEWYSGMNIFLASNCFVFTLSRMASAAPQQVESTLRETGQNSQELKNITEPWENKSLLPFPHGPISPFFRMILSALSDFFDSPTDKLPKKIQWGIWKDSTFGFRFNKMLSHPFPPFHD